MISSDRKIGTIEKQGKEQSWLLRRSDYRKDGCNLEKVYWVLDSVKVVCLARQMSSIEAGNPTQNIAK
jgi:hypothetical protein